MHYARLLWVLTAIMPAIASGQETTTLDGLPVTDVPAVAAVPSARTAVASRAITAPIIDGRDDDEVWRRAQVIQGFRMSEPIEDGEERFRTVAKVAYDERYFYVLVRAYDPRPDSIVALLSRRDVQTPSDWVKVIIDSYHDRRTGYAFAVNPTGVKRDYYTFNDANEDESWDGIWDASAAIDSLGWAAEFRIPFSQLRFGKAASHTFGLMIIRDIARTNERMSWPVFRRSRAGIASQFGEIGGITGIGTPRRLDITPYAIVKSTTLAETDNAGAITGYGRSQQSAAGADIKHGVSSNLTLDATVSPDFGQVEADPAVLNLTAFETFYQERRPFFMEGTGIFRFDIDCSSGQCSGLFYSRRVGRAPQLSGVSGYADARTPTTTAILGAAKLTGRLSNGLSIGVLDALTRHETGVERKTVEPRTNYFVARMQQELRGGESGVGVMFTAVNRSLDAWSWEYLHREAYAGGVDFHHRFLSRAYSIRGFVAGSRVAGSPAAIARTQRSSVRYFHRSDDDGSYDTTRTSLSGDAEQLSFSKVGGGIVRFSTTYVRYSPGFEINDLGFSTQVGRQTWSNWFGLQFNTPGTFYRRASVNFNEWQSWTTRGLDARQRTDIGGNVNAQAELRNSWWLHVGLGAYYFAPAYCTSCARGGPSLRLSPSFNTWVGIEGDRRRLLAPQLWISYGRGDEGRSYNYGINPFLTVRASTRFSITVESNFTRRVSDAHYVDRFGDIATDTVRYTFARLDRTTLEITSRADFTFTPTLSLQAYAQPYVSAGRYTSWRELDHPRAAERDARFKPFAPADPAVSLSAYDFNVKQFRSTSVLRWEYRPGSAIFLVWTQGREQSGRNPGDFRLGRDLGDLFAAHPGSMFLIKLSYRLAP